MGLEEESSELDAAGVNGAEAESAEPVEPEVKVSERWLEFPRRKRTLARSFAFAATTQSPEVLVRHVELNPKDIELPQAKIDDLSKLVDECIARVKLAYRQHTDKRYALTNAAEAAGQLHELSLDSLSPKKREKVLARARFRYNRLSRRDGAPALGANEMPPAHFILTEMLALGTELVSDGVSARIRSGRLLVLRKPQAVGLENEAELLADAKRFFLYQVLAWSLDEGLIGVLDSTRIAEEFEVWIQKV